MAEVEEEEPVGLFQDGLLNFGKEVSPATLFKTLFVADIRPAIERNVPAEAFAAQFGEPFHGLLGVAVHVGGRAISAEQHKIDQIG